MRGDYTNEPRVSTHTLYVHIAHQMKMYGRNDFVQYTQQICVRQRRLPSELRAHTITNKCASARGYAPTYRVKLEPYSSHLAGGLGLAEGATPLGAAGAAGTADAAVPLTWPLTWP